MCSGGRGWNCWNQPDERLKGNQAPPQSCILGLALVSCTDANSRWLEKGAHGGHSKSYIGSTTLGLDFSSFKAANTLKYCAKRPAGTVLGQTAPPAPRRWWRLCAGVPWEPSSSTGGTTRCSVTRRTLHNVYRQRSPGWRGVDRRTCNSVLVAANQRWRNKDKTPRLNLWADWPTRAGRSRGNRRRTARRRFLRRSAQLAYVTGPLRFTLRMLVLASSAVPLPRRRLSQFLFWSHIFHHIKK